jgi:hypothetical protein
MKSRALWLSGAAALVVLAYALYFFVFYDEVGMCVDYEGMWDAERGECIAAEE